MKYEEEGYARALDRALARALERLPGTRLKVTGDGVHWNCTVARGDRACSVSCFDTGGPEYLASFGRADRTEAWGRTASEPDTVDAVARWLAGDGVPDLHARFEFVDREKRALSGLAAAVVQSHPRLRGTDEVRHQMCDLHELWFRAGDRTCRVSYYGKNPAPDAFFHWDGCELFRFRVDEPTALAGVLDKWLSDRAAPSAMAAAFPWLRLGPVARYYEEGRPVEGEFLASWDFVERFYREMGWPLAGPVLGLIADIRRAGYGRVLRAGQSLWSLVVSRSRRHGLRPEQPYVAFDFRQDGMDVHARIGVTEKHSFPALAFTPQVDALLRRLAAEDID